MRKKLVLIFFFQISFGLNLFSQKPVPYKTGEYCSYTLSYGIIKAAYAEYQIKDVVLIWYKNKNVKNSCEPFNLIIFSHIKDFTFNLRSVINCEYYILDHYMTKYHKMQLLRCGNICKLPMKHKIDVWTRQRNFFAKAVTKTYKIYSH